MSEETALSGFASNIVAVPTEEQWKRASDKIIRDTTFVDAATGKVVRGSTPDQVFAPQNLGEGVRRMHADRAEKESMMRDMRWEPWSVVNLMPYPLNVNGVLHRRYLTGPDGNQVAACPVDQPYIHKLINAVAWDIKDEGAGFDNIDNFKNVPFVPKALARDYIQEFIDALRWGVIVYEGSQSPTSTPGLQQKYKEAQQARNTYLSSVCEKANSDWADPRRRLLVTNHHRDAANMLLQLKIMKRQPEWLIASATQVAGNTEPCPNCGNVPEVKPVMCPKCPYVYNPLQAYLNATIPYGDMSMNRMSPEEWATANAEEERRQKNRGGAPATPEPKGKAGRAQQSNA
jgi:hypothetical protein